MYCVYLASLSPWNAINLTVAWSFVQGDHAVHLDKVPTVQWTSRKTEEGRKASFGENRQRPAAVNIQYLSNFVVPTRVRCAKCWKVPDLPAKKCEVSVDRTERVSEHVGSNIRVSANRLHRFHVGAAGKCALPFRGCISPEYCSPNIESV